MERFLDGRKSAVAIFSPEDGTPFSQQPPSLRRGRRRVWRGRSNGDKEEMKRGAWRASRSGEDQSAVEKFDDVENVLIGTMESDAGTELQLAAGIRGDDGLRPGRLRVAHFLGKQLE
jgi:hypothetical protein